MSTPFAITEMFAARYGSPPPLLVHAPLCVRLLGGHTDYNGGAVLAVAIDRMVYVAARPTLEQRITSFAAQFAEQDDFSLEAIEPAAGSLWVNCVRGIARAVQARDLVLGGATLLISSDWPPGSRLSTTAALEVAAGYAFQLLNGFNLLAEELALLAQGAENSFVGVQSGVTEQFVAALGEENHALLISCSDLSYTLVALPSGVDIVLCESTAQQMPAAVAYNQRRAECAEALRLLKPHYSHLAQLSDLQPDELVSCSQWLPPHLLTLVNHIVYENQRVIAGAVALEAGDLEQLGRLMGASYASLRDNYAVSTPELDLLIRIAQRMPGCYGSCITGAGFGGCTVSLVERVETERFCAGVSVAYEQASGDQVQITVCGTSGGVRRVYG